MNKSEFIYAVAEKSGLTKKDSVSFLGFGTFTTASREARIARVPGTDKTVNVPATTVAKFKVGKALKEAVANA